MTEPANTPNLELTKADIERVEAALKGEIEINQLQTTQELHYFVGGYNWSDGLECLQWVARNPLCDKGTALLLYFDATPNFYYENYANRDEIAIAEEKHSFISYSSHVKGIEEDYDFIKELEAKILANYYKTDYFLPEIRNYIQNDWLAWTRSSPDNFKQPIPPEMLKIFSELQKD